MYGVDNAWSISGVNIIISVVMVTVDDVTVGREG